MTNGGRMAHSTRMGCPIGINLRYCTLPSNPALPTGCATGCSLFRTGSGPAFSDLPCYVLEPRPSSCQQTGDSGEETCGADWLTTDISLRNPWALHNNGDGIPKNS